MEVQATKVVKPEADQAFRSHDHINAKDEASGSHVQPMEETKKLSIVTHGHINVEDEASGSHVQPMEETKKLSIVTTLIEPSDIVIDTKYLKDKLDFLKKEAAGKPVKTRIQRVPPMLNENQELKKYYKPAVVAIGPIHHRARDAIRNSENHMDDRKLQGMNINNEQLAFAEQDILLLENQLP
ncbi:hypothetical protein GH714_031812 [Hevea brasiliensis]|uniref:Uncharacterized protein n=1 Tax=Hevea brasiliensis TaxID=3981 RepID=A0A6A6LD79_HEVBR|nr:hypothetical protein GH714_031812 [Hevea brasiliensis]